MKKIPLFIIILLALGLFAAADYYLNNLDAQVVLDLKDQSVSAAPPLSGEPAPAVSSLFQLNETLLNYEVARQVQTRQIFEKIDLSSISNLTVYQNRLEKPGAPADEAVQEPILLYEIHGPKDQGSLMYLNVKLQFIAQINATTETINEDSAFGHNSFFFNDQNYQNTAFLLVQIGDHLFGFQYNKADPTAYDDVKAIIQSLMTE